MRWLILVGMAILVIAELLRPRLGDTKYARGFSTVIAAFGGLLGLIAFWFTTQDNPFAQQVGALKPRFVELHPSERIPEARFSDMELPDGQEVTYGMLSRELIVNVKTGSTVLPLGPNVPFAITKDEEGLLVSMVVKSLDGRMIARLDRNEWQLNPDQYFRRNFDKSALEVIDNFGIPILQIEYLDPQTVRFGGIFPSEKQPIAETYLDFPLGKIVSMGTMRVKYPIILVLGAGTFLTRSQPLSSEGLQGLVSDSRGIMPPWFDYSQPDRLGVRAAAPR